jgi:surface protein
MDWALTSLPIGSFDTSSITGVGDYFFYYFNSAWALTSLPAWSFDTSSITSVWSYFFYYFNWNGALTSLPTWSFNTSNITSVWSSFFSYFNRDWALTSLPAWSFDTSSITSVKSNFFNSFNYYWSLSSLPAGSFDTSNITSAGASFFAHFNRNWALTSLPAGSFNISNITGVVANYFFGNFNWAWALTSLPEWSFDTSNITNVWDYFFGNFNYNWALTSLPVGSFDISNITSVGNDFFRAFNSNWALTSLPTGSFDTSSITDAPYGFFAFFNQNWTLTSLPIGSFNTSSITSVGDYFFRQFNSNWSLTSLPVGSFDTSSITNAGDYFFHLFNYNWKIPKTQSGVRIKNVTSSAIPFHYWNGSYMSESVPAWAYFESYNAGVDNIPPTTTDNISSDWRKTDFPVSLNATDTWAWVHYTLYCTWTTLPPFQCSPNITWTTLTVTCPNNTTCSWIYVSYRSVDLVWNVEPTKTSPEIRIDKQGPSFTFNNRSWPECSNWYLIIINASDTGAGLHTSPYSFNGTTWSTAVSTSIPAQQPWTVTKTWYVRDALTNISTRTATYTFTDVAPTANNFTGHTSVWANARTVNWKNLSNATEWNCGSGSLSAIVSTNGTKWTCSVAGDDLSYTPNVGQFGTDSCVIWIYDNENKYVNITVFWEWIQTISNPLISFTWTTPANNASLNKNRFLTEIQLDQIENIKSFGYNFAGNAYSVYDSWLVLMYNFDRVTALGETTSIIKDMSQYNNTGTNVNNAVWTVEWKHNGAYRFDGTSSYIDAWTADSLNFGTGPFTVMLRAQTNTSGGARSLISKWWTFSNTTGWAIGYAYGPPNIYILLWTWGSRVAYNTQIRMRSWYKLIGFTRENNGDLYFIEDGTKRNISLNFPWNINNNTNLLVWKNNSYYVFSGILDEVRIYNRALSAQEIQFLYKSNLRKVATDRRLFEMLNTCLWWNNTYTYTGYVTSIYDQVASASRKIYTNIPNLFATGLSDFDFGIQQVSEVVETKTGQYNDYIEIHDMLANTWWRITVSASSQLSWQESSFSIPSSNLFFMYNSLDLLSGTLPSTLWLNTSLQNRSNIHIAPVDYFIKNTVPNDFMCDEWVFGDKPFLKLNIPAYQAPDNYVGTLYINVAP